MQGKQAQIGSLTQEQAILGSLATTRSPARDRVMCLLSMKAGQWPRLRCEQFSRQPFPRLFSHPRHTIAQRV